MKDFFSRKYEDLVSEEERERIRNYLSHEMGFSGDETPELESAIVRILGSERMKEAALEIAAEALNEEGSLYEEGSLSNNSNYCSLEAATERERGLKNEAYAFILSEGSLDKFLEYRRGCKAKARADGEPTPPGGWLN